VPAAPEPSTGAPGQPTGAPGQPGDPLAALRATVTAAAASLLRAAPGDRAREVPAGLKVERPKRAGQGDYSTNAAMLLAPILRCAPRQAADQLSAELTERLGDVLERAEVAGPGFVNLFLADGWHRQALVAILDAGGRFGSGGASPARRTLVEFVSANPTGPLVAVAGQSAAYGDALSRILEHHGHSVWREYYFNDAGSQIRLLGESVQARARGEAVPEGGYQGEYVRELAEAISDVGSLPVEEVSGRAVEILLDQITTTLERYGVRFDRFFSERTLHEGSPSYLDRALEMLADAGHTYASEGALWLRTTTYGDEKDRVLRRSGGEPTYFASDVAYLLEKRERGVEMQLLPVGADHHGYVARMKAAFAALGGDPDDLEMPILQFVHLIEGDGRAAMSKRRGDFITLDELLDEIGVDVTRYFMLSRSHDRTVDLDLDLARRQSPENPVYYIQYAHARIVTMLGKLDLAAVTDALEGPGTWGSQPMAAAERELVKTLVGLPDEVADAAQRRAPHRIAAYALELAQSFTAFYRDCQVIGAQPSCVQAQRVALSAAARDVLALSLGLLGVGAPDSM
jgi:arginyl-tRNA synthetase